MNKVYRTVWNEHTNTWVAVQETAKARGKSSQSDGSIVSELGIGGSRFMMTAAASAVLLMSGQAMAVTGVGSTTGNSNYCFYDETSQTVVCGDGTTSSVDTVAGKPAKSVVLGKGATNTGESNVAVGISASSAGTSSVAVGDRAKAAADQAIAVGQNAQANGQWDVSIGRQAAWNTQSSQGRNIAIGDAALRNASTTSNNIAMGTSAAEALSTTSNSVTIGTYANSDQAIGSALANGSTEAQLGFKRGNFTDADGHPKNNFRHLEKADNTVAVGHRALTTKTAAVAVGQQAKGLGTTSVAVGNGSRALGTNSVAMGNTANAGAAGAIAIGQQANYQPHVAAQGSNPEIKAAYKTTGTNSVAIGVRTHAGATHAVAIGTEATTSTTGQGSVAVGSLSKAVGVNAAAIGQAAEAKGKNAFAGGNDSHALGISAVAIGDGAGKGDPMRDNPADPQEITGYTGASGDSSTAVGTYTKAAGAGATALGVSANAETYRSAALGAYSTAKGGNSALAAGDSATANGEKSTAIGHGSTAEGKSNIAIGDKAYTHTGQGGIAIGSEYTGLERDGTTPVNASSVKAWSDNAIAIGTGAEAGLDNKNKTQTNAGKTGAIAIGTRALAYEVSSAALGEKAGAFGINSVAVGANSTALEKSGVALGDQAESKAVSTVAVGANASANGTSAVAIGDTTKTGITAHAAVVIGANAKTDLENAVALGAYSTANRDKFANAPTAAADATFAGNKVYALEQASTDDLKAIQGTAANTYAAVSVGGADAARKVFTRQITNVAAGSEDSDAVNVAQLKAVANKLQAGQTHYYSVNDNGTPTGNHDNLGATADRALAAGVNASATKFGATAVGNSAVASDLEAVAVGTRAAASSTATVAIGEGAKASNTSAIAIGLNTEASGSNSFVLGSGSVTSNPDNKLAKASGNQAIAVGYQTQALGTNNTAIGANATAGSETASIINATALGTSATASAANSLAVGAGANAAGASSVAVGRASKTYTGNDIAIGSDAEAGVKGATESSHAIAMGRGAKATQIQAVAIGNSAKVEQAHGIALGSNSVANVAAGAAGADPLNAGFQNNSTWKATHAALSIGNGTTVTRQITSVAAGTNDTDAVNVAQLKAAGFNFTTSQSGAGTAASTTVAKVKNGETFTLDAGDGISLVQNGSTVTVAVNNAQLNALGTHYYSVKSSKQGAGSNYNNDGATAAGALAAGVDALAEAKNAVAIGNGAHVAPSGLKSVWNPVTKSYENETSPSENAVAVGHQAAAKGDSALALGAGSKVDFMNSVAVGARAKALGYNGSAFGVEATAKGYSSIAIGDKAEAGAQDANAAPKANFAVAIGTSSKATGETAVALGSNAETTGHRGTALGVRSQVTAGMGVALGGYSIANRAEGLAGVDPLNAKAAGAAENVWTATASAVSVGGGINPVNKKPITRQITYVAAGTNDTDAVNVAQLKAAGFKLAVSQSGGSATNSTATNATGAADDKIVNGESFTLDAGQGISLVQNGGTVTIATNAQTLAESAQQPVVYTNADGDKLYLVEKDDPNGPPGTKMKVFNTKADGTGTDVDPPNVIASMQNAAGQTIYPMTLANVAAGSKAHDAVNVSQLGAAGIYNTDADGNLAYTDENGNTVYRKPNGSYVNTQGDTVTPRGQLTLQNKGLNFAGNSGTGNTKLGETWNIVGGKVNTQSGTREFTAGTFSGGNIQTKVRNGLVEITMADSPKFGDIVINAPAVTDPQNPSNNRLAGRITGVTAGVDDNDVVTVAQLKNVANGTNASPLTFAGDTGGDVSRKLGETVKIVGGMDDVSLLSDGANIGVVANGSDTLEIQLAKDLTGLGSAQFEDADGNITTVDGNGITIEPADPNKDAVSLTGSGLNNGGNVISNVASGLNGKTLDEIKADPDAAERSNAATIGDLTLVQSNVTNVTNVVNNVVGGDDLIDPKTGELTDEGKLALTTYNVSGNNATNTNTLISAIKNMNEGGIKFFHVNDGTNKQDTAGTVENEQDSSASGKFAAAVGYQAKASGENALAFGKGAVASGDNSISIGTGNQVTGDNSGAIGGPSIVDGNNSYSVGNNNAISNTANNSFVLGGQNSLGGTAVRDANGVIDPTQPITVKGTANNSAVIGNKNTVQTDNTFVLGNEVTQTLANSVFLGNQAGSTGVHKANASAANPSYYTYKGDNDTNVAGVKDVVGVVSVGKDGQTRQIQNVAAGVVSADSTDAINGSQLYYTHKAIEGIKNGAAGIVQYSNPDNPTQPNGGTVSNDVTLVGTTDGSGKPNPVTIHNVDAGRAPTDAVNVGQLNALGARLDGVANTANAGVAQAIATAGLPQAYLPGKSMVAVGGGYYKGETGYAVGFSTISDGGNWIIKGTASGNSRGHFGASVGAGYQW